MEHFIPGVDTEIDVCKLAITPFKDKVVKPMDDAIQSISNSLTNTVMSPLNSAINLFTNIINDIITALENGIHKFTNIINNITKDIKDLIIILTTASLGNVIGILKLLILPYVLQLTSLFENTTGISIQTAILIATVLAILPIIGNIYMILKFAAKILL